MRLRAAASTLGSSAAIPLASLITAPLIARGLGVGDRGRLAAALAVSALTTTILGFGLQDYVLALTASSGEIPIWLRRKVLRYLGVLALLAAVALAATRAGTTPVLVVAIVALALITQWRRQELLGLGLSGRIIAERWLQAALRLILFSLVCFSVQLTLNDALTVTAAISLLAAGVIFKRAPAGSRRSGSVSDLATTRAMASFGLTSWLSGLAMAGVLRLDQVALGLARGSHELGLYAVAVGLSEAMMFVPTAIKPVLQSDISRQGTIAPLRNVLLIVVGSMSVLAAGVGLLAHRIVVVLFGAAFAPAAPAVRLLALASIFIGVTDVCVAALMVLGRPRGAVIGSVSALAMTAVALPLLVHYGSTGTAWASVVAYASGALAVLVYVYGNRFGSRRSLEAPEPSSA